MATSLPELEPRTASLGLRLAGGFAGACTVVLVLAMFAAWLIRLFDDNNDEDVIYAQPVQLLSGYSSVDLKELLGEPRYQLPELAAPPPAVVAPTRTVSGFVMVEVEVDSNGRATAARVIEATPPGIYDEQAIADALAADYPSGSAGTRDTLIRFSMPVDEVR